MMRRCLTWFPFGELVEPNIYHHLVCFTRMWDFSWRVTDREELVGVTWSCVCLCEELVGVTHRRRQKKD